MLVTFLFVLFAFTFVEFELASPPDDESEEELEPVEELEPLEEDEAELDEYELEPLLEEPDPSEELELDEYELGSLEELESEELELELLEGAETSEEVTSSTYSEPCPGWEHTAVAAKDTIKIIEINNAKYLYFILSPSYYNNKLNLIK